MCVCVCVCSYPFNPEVVGKLASDPSVMALAPHTLPEAESTMAYLDLLIRDLKRRGFDTHVLPLFQLQRLVARLALRNEVRDTHTHTHSHTHRHTDCIQTSGQIATLRAYTHTLPVCAREYKRMRVQ